MGWKVALFVVFVLAAVAVAVGLPLGWRKQAEEARRRGEAEIAQLKLEHQRLRGEVERAQAEQAKAEAELAKVRLEREEEAKSAEKTRANSDGDSPKEIARREEEKRQREEVARERLKANPKALALWDEKDHAAVKVTGTRLTEATVQHSGASVTLRYEDMPDWLRIAAQDRHRQEGEARGLIRELNGKTYDLRNAPPGWIALPLAEVIQILSDGYLMADVNSMRQQTAQLRTFKLVHNGLTRILNVGDRLQLSAMSVGTYTYENRKFETARVPVYDPGMPVGPLRERVVPMRAMPGSAPNVASKEARPPGGEEPDTMGSGFFVSEDGLFITNAHVVEKAKKVEVKIGSGKKTATVLKMDKEKDLALLRVGVDGAAPALRVSTNNYGIGTQVFTIGYPVVDIQGLQPKYTDGKISSVAGARDNPDHMQISVAVQPGNSGGPLADVNGDVAGVVVAQLDDLRMMEMTGVVPQNVNYAVKASTLARFLRENRNLAPRVQFGPSPKRSQEDAIRLVEKASGLVIVYE
ncbi:MAG TPA: trypsin-like peptidase domain-containing protein [Verrucomicrobiae bacterium]|nr:trypsin-like peptidase domain-containing protein [Verrucomicrobiae bacterium]